MSLIILFNPTTKIGDWSISTHSRHGSKAYDRKHVHITKRGLKGEYSWNIDGTRHDAHRFPKNEDCINRAKSLAASALDIPVGILQLITQFEGGVHFYIQDNLDSHPEKKLFNTYVHKGKVITLLGSEKGLVVVIDHI
jgi:hypothetical protein